MSIRQRNTLHLVKHDLSVKKENYHFLAVCKCTKKRKVEKIEEIENEDSASINVKLNNINVKMQVDSGSQVTNYNVSELLN